MIMAWVAVLAILLATLSESRVVPRPAVPRPADTDVRRGVDAEMLGSSEDLLRKIASARPQGADPAFDCAWRKYAYQYAVQIQPWLLYDKTKTRELFDALQLAPLCKQHYAPPTPPPSSSPPHPRHNPADDARDDDTVAFYVDAVHGSDDQPFAPDSGSLQKPFQTLASALAATRAVRSTLPPPAPPAAVYLRQGTHYIADTVQLTPMDSLLTITAYNNEKVVVSGGIHLSGLQWAPAAGMPSGVFKTDLSHHLLPHGVPALQYGPEDDRVRATLARYPNANPELDLFPTGYITAKTRWIAPTFHGTTCDSHRQCGQSVNITLPAPDHEWHGMYQSFAVGVGGACDVYDPPQSPWCSGQFYLERQFPEMHTRHPDGLVLDDQLPNAPKYSAPGGSTVHAWRSGHWYTWMFQVDDVSASGGGGSATWQTYAGQNNVYGLVQTPKQSNDRVTYLGTFQTADDCWAACNATSSSHNSPSSPSSNPHCGDWTWHHTDLDDSEFAGGCYTVIHGGWNPTPQTKVTSGRGPHGADVQMMFGAGGNQGGEGNDEAGEWFIEGVQEELDAPNEFWYDDVSRQLYMMPNGTDTPPTDVVVPSLANILVLTGSQAHPIHNVTISGIKFTATRPTFMEPRGNPSGGDWALERMGAILLEGTESVRIDANRFERLDSNAVFISGYNRHAHIVNNTFKWLGQNAIASWGRAVLNDGTNGEYPRHTLIENNHVSEIGHIQKQSSFYFQAETAQTTIRNNICYNIPRAAVNFNDGFGGGSEMVRNLLFNTCRESSDHGAFNSWDRLPYFTTVRNGTASTIPADNDVHHNFIVANYAADGGCLDNDDGSSYYQIHHNFCVYGGHKSDFDGNSKVSYGNIHAYASVYGAKCVGILQAAPPKGYAEGYHNNICILASSGDTYLDVGGLQGQPCLKNTTISKKTFEDGMAVSNNTLYAPGGKVSITCGGVKLDLEQFQALGYDLGTSVSGDMPDPTTVIGWAQGLLS